MGSGEVPRQWRLHRELQLVSSTLLIGMYLCLHLHKLSCSLAISECEIISGPTPLKKGTMIRVDDVDKLFDLSPC